MHVQKTVKCFGWFKLNIKHKYFVLKIARPLGWDMVNWKSCKDSL
jgi:hypothetical protein